MRSGFVANSGCQPVLFPAHLRFLTGDSLCRRLVNLRLLQTKKPAELSTCQEVGVMKRVALLFIFVVSAAALLQSQEKWSFKGTVVKMRLTECVAQRSFMTVVSGTQAQADGSCPEYTVLGDKVVYVIVGRHSDEFIPLAEHMDFVIRKNELVIFSDDEKTRSRFVISSMTLREDWDHQQAIKDLAVKIAERHLDYEVNEPPPLAMAPIRAR